jgi:hypothetical protein
LPLVALFLFADVRFPKKKFIFVLINKKYTSMKKIFLIMALASGTAISAAAQDTIVKRDGSEVIAKVLKVGVDEVEYVKFNAQDGPLYILPASAISIIKYANGDRDIFKLTNSTPRQDYGYGYAPPSYQQIAQNPDFIPKNQTVAWGLSLLFPGLGQFYNGENKKGIIFLAVGGTSLLVAVSADPYGDLVGWFSAAFVTSWIWSQIDAPSSAKRLNRQNGYFSWNVGEKSVLSLEPDMKVAARAGEAPLPSYGMSLKWRF